jgi:Trypsin
MKEQQTIGRSAIRTGNFGLAEVASRTLAGAVALLLISAALGGRAWAITFSEPDQGRHPNVCAVIAIHPIFGLIPFSGTLISDRVVLTAGHAVQLIEAGEAVLYGVSFDQNVDVNNPGTWLEVSATAAVYTRFDVQKVGGNPANADIAVLILKDSVTTITPATLPGLGLLDELRKAGQLESGPDGTKLTVVGYGFGLNWPPPQPVFPISDEGIVARNAAQSGYLGFNPGFLVLNQTPAAGFGGTGLGDSGGPAFLTDPETGNEVLVGITAWSGTLGSGHYWRVDTATSLQFIQDVIDSLETKSPRPQARQG